MLKSMTGYGAAEGTVGGRPLFVEIKTVNHRYFNFFTKLPQSLLSFEGRIQALAKERLSRGQINVFASWDRKAGGAQALTLNLEAARQAAELLRKVRDELNLAGDVELSHILSIPAVVAAQEAGLSDEEAWPQIRAVFDAALTDMEKLRAREGSDLEKDLLARLIVFSGYMDEVERRRPEIVAENKARFDKRIHELCAEAVSSEVIAERVALEVAIFADRCDVSEEIVRLKSHIDKFRELLVAEGGVGRKLDFLIQEMNRETNTIGSKTPHAETSRTVVEMKAELERIREQVQNVE
jgi:uncharacterized protein (TIGR00255 family)